MIPSLVSGYRLPIVLLGRVLLVGVGCAGGIWLSAGNYRPLPDQANGKVGKSASTSG